MDRWVCKRCFASNDGDLGACATCGLERGALPPPGETPIALPEMAGQRSWWVSLLRFWWVGALVVVVIVGYISQAHRDNAGQIQSAGKVDITDLRVGDCYDYEGAASDEISEVTGRPCSKTHQYELFAIVSDTAHDTYPGDSGFDDLVEQQCGPAFEAWVGTAYDRSALDIAFVFPSEDSWGQGDRVVTCAVYDTSNPTLTRSLKGSHR